MTSANVTNYTVRHKATKERVGKHSQHSYCKQNWTTLLSYQPADDYEIHAWGLDEEEEIWHQTNARGEELWKSLALFLSQKITNPPPPKPQSSETSCKKEWLTPDSNGKTKVHIKIRAGEANYIPTDLLTKENLLLRDKIGMTALHYLARYGKINLAPASVMEVKYLTLQNNHKSSILHYAALSGTLGKIPKNMLSMDVMMQRDSAGKTIFHAAAIGYCFDQIPSELITEEVLTAKQASGDTLLHTLAFQAQLLNEKKPIVPIELLTEYALGIQAKDGRTPMHGIACNAHISQLQLLDKGAITQNLLSIKDKTATTPLHLLADNAQVAMVKHLITTEMLIEPNNNDLTPLIAAKKANNLDALLGIWLPISQINIVGEQWWNKNNAITQLTKVEKNHTLDIF